MGVYCFYLGEAGIKEEVQRIAYSNVIIKNKTKIEDDVMIDAISHIKENIVTSCFLKLHTRQVNVWIYSIQYIFWIKDILTRTYGQNLFQTCH